jgi:hypothetical protein
LIRHVLDRPGTEMTVYTKIATVFFEDWRASAQFDGSITKLYPRSSMAALAAGATVANMSLPEIVWNIERASDYTRDLRSPRFTDWFPGAAPSPESDIIKRGHDVYVAHCKSCHGDRNGNGWARGDQMDQIATLDKVATDPERVMFRHYGKLPARLFELFPKDHPFHFARHEMRPSDAEADCKDKCASVRGYVNQPPDGMWIRRPPSGKAICARCSSI